MTQSNPAPTNHPLAPRMCAIAFLSYNVSLACMYGSFSVLLRAVEAKLGITRDLSSLGIPLVMLGIAVGSPFAGILAGKFSLRLLMLTGAFLNLVAYVVLALSTNIYINFAAYGLLIGPGLSITATVLPSTLVTRWYVVNRGRALGLITMPIALAILPLLAAFLLKGYGLSVTYIVLAAVIALLMVPLLFIIDFPPSALGARGEYAAIKAAANTGMTVSQLLRNGRFWALSLASAAVTTNAVIRSAHLVPMVADWGIDTTRAATLVTVSAVAGMVGTVTFGWIADRLGGAVALALLCIDSAILWAVMLSQPSYTALFPIVSLMSFHSAAIVPAFGLALSQQFGPENFARAFGLGYFLALPFNVLGVPIAARVYMSTGSYANAMIGLIGVLLVAAALAATVRGVKPVAAAA